MAEVIHTRKGKYQYKYEHTRKGDKVVSRYMYPVDSAGDRVKPYQERVAQQTFPQDNKLRVIHQIDNQIFIVEMKGVKKVYPETYKDFDYIVFKSPLKLNNAWVAIDKRTGLSLIYQDVIIKTRKQCNELVHKNFDKMGGKEDIIKACDKGIDKVNQYWNDNRVNKVVNPYIKNEYKTYNGWEEKMMKDAGYIKTGVGVFRKRSCTT